MLPNPPSDQWLERINIEFRSKNVETRCRPYEAVKRYFEELGVNSYPLSSPLTSRIFEWFYLHTKLQDHRMHPLFIGVFFYDTSFWKVTVPNIVGEVEVQSIDSLEDMPKSVSRALQQSSNSLREYNRLWVDCFDYGLGIDDLRLTSTHDNYIHRLLSNADRELHSAICQLLWYHPNYKAAMSCRMALEVFLKAYLVAKAQWNENQLKKISHNLESLISESKKLGLELSSVTQYINVFPKIDARYTGEEINRRELWKTYAITQHTATTIIRSFTGRNILSQNPTIAAYL